MRVGDRIGTATIASVAGQRADNGSVATHSTDEPYVCVTVHVKTRNPTNNLRHWRTLKREADEQKAATMLALIGVTAATWTELAKGCHVKLTRLSAGTLDEDDNVRTALKHVKDIICQFLFGGAIGERDDDKRATWEYCQMKVKRGTHCVIVSIGRRE